MRWYILFFIVFGMQFFKPVTGFSIECPEIKEQSKKMIVSKVIDRFYLYDCTDVALGKALEQKKMSPLATRLFRYTCKLAQKGMRENEIMDALHQRGMSMAAAFTKAEIDCRSAEFAGLPKAPVELIVYLCPRCPFCRVITPKLHTLVTQGALKGKVRMAFRTFPIKDHAGSLEGAFAMQSALKAGQGWAYLLRVYENFDMYSPDKLIHWALSLGMDQKEFKKQMVSGQIRNEVIASKKEGRRNAVRETPTFFINRKKYRGLLDVFSITDALHEEYDRVTGTLCGQ